MSRRQSPARCLAMSFGNSGTTSLPSFAGEDSCQAHKPKQKGGCQNYGPLRGPLNTRYLVIFRTQKSDYNFDNQACTHQMLISLFLPLPFLSFASLAVLSFPFLSLLFLNNAPTSNLPRAPAACWPSEISRSSSNNL